MAFGVVVGEKRRINKGVSIYKSAIRGMRRDGSLPNDSERWGSAIHYTNVAIASLVVMAEIAANQGVDLYGFKAGQKSLDHAISFLIEVTQNPILITGYAKRGQGTGSFRGFTATNQKNDWHSKYGAFWGHYYIARFPKSVTARNLNQVSSILRSGRSEAQNIIGGDPRCFVLK